VAAVKEWGTLADQGDEKAQITLGRMYYWGQGVPKNIETAKKWFRLAAAQGNKEAERYLAGSNSSPTANQSDKSPIERIFQAAQQGDARAQYTVGQLYQAGKGVRQSYETAFKWMSLSANQGNAMAQNRLGYFYSQGLGVRQDDKLAVSWYMRAAKQGLAKAQHNLGVSYTEGRGVPRDHAEAAKWHRMAADQGITESTKIVSSYDEILAPDDEQQQSENAAPSATVQAFDDANPTDPEAQLDLAVRYLTGLGARQNKETAVAWFRRSAEQGNRNAQTLLGVVYNDGIGVEQDFELAAKWFTRAAKQGSKTSQFLLAGLYHDGTGVERDKVRSYMWLNMAMEPGASVDQRVAMLLKGRLLPYIKRELLRRLERKMIPRQRQEAYRLMSECYTSNFENC